MADGNALIKVDGKLTEPATVLIQKISEAVGGYFKPYQIRRVAKAEAEAEIIKEQAQIEITDIHRRAFTRFITEEAKKQENIESITEKAIPLLTESSKPKDMGNDWIMNFFDKCRIISDEEMQTLWAKVLAGEANSPGTFSKRAVNSLGSLDKKEAQLFAKLCSFVALIIEIDASDLMPLIYDQKAAIYTNEGINFDTLTSLDDIGLISFSGIATFKKIELSQHIDVNYQGLTLKLEFSNPENNELETGIAILTDIGREFARICSVKPVDGFVEYVTERWKQHGIIVLYAKLD